MRRKLFQTGIAVFLMLCLMAAAACAETVRGDLSERFSDIPRIEYEGESYALKNRITTVLAMGIDKGENDKNLSLVNFMLVIDDNAKTFTVMEIPPDALVEFPMDDGTVSNMRFRDVYALGLDSDDGGVKMVRAMNTLLNEDRVEHYLAFDAQGAVVLDESLAAIEDTRERLKGMKALVEGMNSDQLNDTYKLLGDYIITDMKSGAVMKVIDKMDRYEVLPRLMLPGTACEGSDGAPLFNPDANEILKLLVNAFYEADRY